MENNALIFGAGISYDAKVPMIDTFIEKLRGYALRGFAGDKQLSKEDIRIFRDAITVLDELSEYHRGAAFNDRNLEDLLSILSFNILGNEDSEKTKLEKMINAIVRTIELSCEVNHDGNLLRSQLEGNELYRRFWDCMFKEWDKKKSLPIIISLNYDLVLERSLFQSLIKNRPSKIDSDFDGLILDYKYKMLPRYSYKLSWGSFLTDPPSTGTYLEKCEEKKLRNPIIVEILKLHGSLNFPLNKIDDYSDAPTYVVEKPLLVPPISNKLINDDIAIVWNSALKHLRKINNLVIVGYSLPRTDAYMQFFLKTALGPNKDFDKLTIFNPTLFEDSEKANDMKQRYSNCFSEQLKNYITFQPKRYKNLNSFDTPGTFHHFIEIMSYYPDELFF